MLSAFPAQVSAAEGYLRIVGVSVVPATVVVGKAFTVQVEVEWRNLLVFLVRPSPPPGVIQTASVRVEICEGNDVATCKPLAFAPSESGEEVEPDGAETHSKTYSIGLQAPLYAQTWYLTAIFEIAADQTGASVGSLRRDGWYVISSSGFDPWRQFEVEVNPDPDATVNSRILFTEGFESGQLADPWKATGQIMVEELVSFVDNRWIDEGHTGRYVVLLGADVKSDFQSRYPYESGPFSLERDVAVTPSSTLTVTFWYRGWLPYGQPPDGHLLQVQLVFSIATLGLETLDQTIIDQSGLAETWQSLTRSVLIPASTTSVLLRYSGLGAQDGHVAGRGYYGGIEVDDISVFETVTRTLVQATQTLVQTTAVSTAQTEIQTETTSSQADASVSLVSTFLQTNLPYLAAVLAAVLMVAVLLARKKARTQATIDRVFCSQCGTQNPQSNEFCGKCGQRLERAT